VSVGEVKAVSPLVKKILTDFPDLPILVTTTTSTGAEIVELEFESSVLHFYFPIDFPSVLSRFINRVNPKALFLVETELWPNLLKICDAKGIPACIVNGRMSPTSYKNYFKARLVTAPAFETLSLVLAQTEKYARWYRDLGVNPSKIITVGNLKFDVEIGEQSISRAGVLRERLGLTSKKVMCFGSFREGEEAFILEAMTNLRTRMPEVVFIMAPRHLERISFVEKLVVSSGLSVMHQSSFESGENFDVLLIDTLGYLLSYYAVADVAFVGGSILPYGGQNVLEPIAVKVPVITGSFTFNFSEICEELLSKGALVIAPSPLKLSESAEALLVSRDLALNQSSRATEVMENSKGATKLTLEALKPFFCS
jgi:3-deoxy-D-manno-octulosonic-acid transferase